MDILNYENYLESCSLKNVATTIVGELRKTISTSNAEKDFLIGFHIRHFLDSTSPTYVAGHSNSGFDSEISKIIEENKATGRHTFNHLIDALYYQKGEPKKSAIQDKDTLIHTQITFKEVKSETNVMCDESFIKSNAEFTLSDFSFNGENYHEHFFELLPTINKFCKGVGLDNNIVNLKAIHNSVEQLYTFKKFGEIIDIIVLRPKFEIGYVLGFTIIRNSEDFHIQQAFDQLSSYFKFLNYQTSFSENKLTGSRTSGSSSIYQIEKYKGISYHDLQPIPSEIIKAIINDITNTAQSQTKLPFNILEGVSGGENELKKNSLFKSLKSFLSMLYEFSDEQVEGKKITYGFVLGNPGLFDFLKGRNVLPGVTDGSNNQFLELDGYRKNFHLFSNHLETALVVPYSEIISNDDSKLPFFFMDVKNFEEDIFNWDYGALIPSQYRPYAYISYRFPWAVSAVVGPGSQIRVFSNGKIIAFKDGKGWKIYGDSIDKLKSFTCWSNEVEKAKIQRFMDIVCMLSPIYNIESHGGFVTYSSDLPTDKTKADEFLENFQALTNQEPKWQANCQWLKGRNLFKVDGEIDYEVAQRLIQISVLDGATIFVNENYKIKNFGMRLNFEGEEGTKSYGGTKTKSAQNYVEWCQKNEMKKSFAIAISSDGPLKIFHPDSKQENELVPLYIYNKVKKGKE